MKDLSPGFGLWTKAAFSVERVIIYGNQHGSDTRRLGCF